jgi:hypothetical protein
MKPYFNGVRIGAWARKIARPLHPRETPDSGESG